MIRHGRTHKLTLKPDTIRVLSRQEAALAVGGSAGGSAPSNTVSGDDCGPGHGQSYQGTCIKTF